MPRLNRVLGFSVLLLIALGTMSSGQPALLGKIEEAKEAARSLSHYPKEVRDAILEVAQHPGLGDKLAALKGPKDPALDKTLAAYNANVKKAGALLVAFPEVLQTMHEYPGLTALIGKFYAARKDEFQRVFDKEEKVNNEAVDAWAQRLQKNPEVLDQLLAAAAAFVKQLQAAANPGAAANVVYSPTVYAGANVTGTAAAIYSLPAGEFAAYALAHADTYPALANAVVGQWLEHPNNGHFDAAVGDWWHKHEGVVPDHVLDPDAHRADRLGEMARFDRSLPKDKPLDKQQKQDALKKKAGDYPQLAGKAGYASAPKPTPTKPTPTKPTTNPPANRKVEKQPAPQAQQVHHASANHNNSWQKQQKGGGGHGGGKPKTGKR